MMNYLPFTRPYLDENTITQVTEVLRSGWISSGTKVKAFEAALSAYCGGRPTRVVNSATAALQLALSLAGVKANDEVITTPISWVATANVILQQGARPVFVDVDEKTRNIDLNLLEAAINKRTRAIISVDLAGLPVDREALYQIAQRHGLRVIEDAAQAMGSTYRQRPIGSFGDLVVFSFHANKNITTAEGGCLVMNSAEEAIQAEQLRLQGIVRGSEDQMDCVALGHKMNMTDIAAQIGLCQLEQLAAITARRRELAKHYFDCLGADLFLGLPLADFSQSNWHMFQVLLPLARLSISRAEFMRAMAQHNIGTGVHYPPIHLFSLYRALGYRAGSYPVAEKIGREIVTLPLFPAMEMHDVERVCMALRQILVAALPG